MDTFILEEIVKYTHRLIALQTLLNLYKDRSEYERRRQILCDKIQSTEDKLDELLETFE